MAQQIGLEASAKKLKRSPYDLVIIASLIEREVNKDEYRDKVARVVYNRLAEEMPLDWIPPSSTRRG